MYCESRTANPGQVPGQAAGRRAPRPAGNRGGCGGDVAAEHVPAGGLQLAVRAARAARAEPARLRAVRRDAGDDAHHKRRREEPAAADREDRALRRRDAAVIVVASVETGCVPAPSSTCTPLDGRYVVNLVSVHFDHFEAVISRIDKPFSFQLSDSDELWLSWFAYGFAQPATGGEQGEIDEAYNEPLRPLLHTLPARAAGLRRSQPSEALRPVRWRGARQPALAALCLRREGRRGPRALPRLRRAVGGGRAAPVGATTTRSS